MQINERELELFSFAVSLNGTGQIEKLKTMLQIQCRLHASRGQLRCF